MGLTKAEQGAIEREQGKQRDWLGELEDLLRTDERLRGIARGVHAWLEDVLSDLEPPTGAIEVSAGDDSGDDSGVEESGGDAADVLEGRREVPVELRLGGERVVINVPVDGATAVGGAAVGIGAETVGPAGAGVLDSNARGEGSRVPEPDTPTRSGGALVLEPAQIARQAHHCAECLRWSIERAHRELQGASFEQSIRPRDAELTQRARELEFFAWPLDPYTAAIEEGHLELLANAYENVAAVLELAGEMTGVEAPSSDWVAECLQLAAQAQSALFHGLRSYADREHDAIQDAAFGWLRRFTREHQCYVPRYMRLKDSADPERWHPLAEAIEKLRSTWEAERARSRKRKSLLGKVRYHLERIGGRGGDDPLGETPQDWRRIDDAVSEWISEGFPASNPELRDLLLPRIEEIPEELEVNEGLGRVLEEIDIFLARLEQGKVEPREEPAPSPELCEAAELLAGKTVLLIGGEARPKSREALERSLGLAQLRWLPAPKKTSVTRFESEIARGEVDLVLVAIRWVSHEVSGVDRYCRKHDKLCVRLQAGYSPNQVAHRILEQVGRQLRAARG